MALTNKRDYPIAVSLSLDNGSIVSGSQRSVIGHLEGNAPQSPGYFLFSGGSKQLPSKKMEWVIQKGSGDSLKVTVATSCAKGGKDEKTLTLR